MCMAQLQAKSALISIIHVHNNIEYMCVNLCGMLIHRSRVNSSLCLEKSGCSQTLIKVGGVLIYKWVEHVPDT